ncbi:acyl-CoA dehydrogenase family protein [Streptomyces nigrescens]|uniref:Acyl-CoA dehydrogenase n=1 Tax=Streptomyces nigrescens TaxID=1920 RepID=A0A640TJC7_STRNI|nr:acyl-CoA dehydrogenase family protein [Streptomyces libani]WAT97781.1 acyl-CoA/acyl-ACP dehydrogenase [Streptomyces libani subsp. libani]GFE23320.1 acyl-CoA dehydrogenase [Streptomyces libani subsp. libani]GGV92688.1 acyl-CoA dehydrogenase [Streptomyces libani subsp. libani]
MDFTPTPEQTAARELAAEIFGDLSTPERLAAGGSGTDAGLWKALCAAGLPGAAEETGLLGLVLMLEEQGRTTAQVPFAATCVYGLLAVGAHGSAAQRARLLPALRAGDAVATGAFPARRGGVRAEEAADGTGRLTGVVPVVPWLRAATHVLVPDGDTRTLWLVRPDDAGARRDPVETTAPWSAGRLTLDGAPAERLGHDAQALARTTEAPARTTAEPARPTESTPTPDPTHPDPYTDTLTLARTAFAGLQAGVCAGSLARAVSHTTTREQFGRPLSTNQGVLLRAADAHMDIEAIRLTAYEAAWRRDAGLDAGPHALTAAWWASEAGTRVVHTGQHLHGGIGADVDHPVHRHFLWGRQLAGYLGSGAEALEELGELLTGERSTPAARPDEPPRARRPGPADPDHPPGPAAPDQPTRTRTEAP